MSGPIRSDGTIRGPAIPDASQQSIQKASNKNSYLNLPPNKSQQSIPTISKSNAASNAADVTQAKMASSQSKAKLPSSVVESTITRLGKMDTTKKLEAMEEKFLKGYELPVGAKGAKREKEEIIADVDENIKQVKKLPRDQQQKAIDAYREKKQKEIADLDKAIKLLEKDKNKT